MGAMQDYFDVASFRVLRKRFLEDYAKFSDKKHYQLLKKSQLNLEDIFCWVNSAFEFVEKMEPEVYDHACQYADRQVKELHTPHYTKDQLDDLRHMFEGRC